MFKDSKGVVINKGDVLMSISGNMLITYRVMDVETEELKASLFCNNEKCWFTQHNINDLGIVVNKEKI